MDFDLENLIYIFGALAYFASAIFGWFKDKNKKKNIEDAAEENKEIQEDKIPKTFQDLVEQVKSELDQNDDEKELVIEEEIKEEEVPSIDNINSEVKENIEEKNIIQETEKQSDKSSSKRVERLDGYKIIEETNEKFENELFNELNDSNSLKKAFLFKEILKRKF
mgnify:FL=1|tara:strand:- start:1742 stop:2236 length:495 start_codon:yes stop_codon:yes gene_type:complete